MTVRFPHANNYRVTDEEFRGAWFQLHRLFPSTMPASTLPRLHNRNPLTVMEDGRQHLSLEYLCRNLVPTSYRNVMQGTSRFLQANTHILRPTSEHVINPASEQKVQGVELIGKLDAAVVPAIVALFESDADQVVPLKRISTWCLNDLVAVERTGGVIDNSPEGPSGEGAITQEDVTNILDRMMNGSHEYWNPAGEVDYVDEFVLALHQDPFVPRYRGKRVYESGVSVLGWDHRLAKYFWPNPEVGIAANQQALAGIGTTATTLSRAVTDDIPWSPAEQQTAVRWAQDIFKWGGVRQDPETITAINIRNVVKAALTGEVAPGTPMNSGWTKVAAFASSHLGDRGAQVIWDSRVSTSIVRRLDALFHAHRLVDIPAAFSGIGLVNVGRGGTRPIDLGSLKYEWPNGYQNWGAQFAASRFVREVCARLNDGLVSSERRGQWTVRDVEMVLFGDGY
jgi:hypothetical protein